MPIDNGIQFADLPKNRQGPTARFRSHPFDRLCLIHGTEHQLTKPNHPWTNGQLERMNRPIKDATIKRYFYGTHNQPYEYLCKLWTQTPDSLPSTNPSHSGTKHLDGPQREPLPSLGTKPDPAAHSPANNMRN